VLGRGSLYTLATAGPALAAIAVIPVLTRLLDPAQYGVVAVATALVQVGYIVVALGLGAAITRQYILDRGGPEGARTLVLQGAALAAVLTLAAALAAPLWSPTVLDRPASTEVLLALLASWGGASMVLAQAYLRGADRAQAFVVLAVTATFLGPAAGLGLVAAGDRTATPYLVGLAGGYLAAGLGGVVLVLRSGPRAGRPGGLRAALRIGLPTVPHQVSLYLALAGLVVVADRTLGGVEAGRAQIALMVGAGATVVTAGLNNAWAPLVYRTIPEQRPRVLTETTRTVAAVTVALSGTVALLSPWILRLAAGAEYRPDDLVAVVALASAAAVPSVLYLASGHLVFAGGRTSGLALTTPVAVVAGLLWALAAVPSWGLVAAGSGYLVTYLVLALGTTMLQRRVGGAAWLPPALPVVTVLWIGSTVTGAALPAGATFARSGLTALVVVSALGLVGGRSLLRRPLKRPGT
jgi:O-antigen/teichoic acid export membrane protein